MKSIEKLEILINSIGCLIFAIILTISEDGGLNIIGCFFYAVAIVGFLMFLITIFYKEK